MSLVRKRIVLPLIPTDIFQVIRPTQNKDAVLDLTYQQLLTALSEVFSGGGSLILLKTDGVDNGNQNLLNLVAGPGITLSDDNVGNITITSTGGTGGTYTVNNGLSPQPGDPNNFQLGGDLIENTIIDNANSYNLSVIGEYNGGALFYVSNPIVTSFEDPSTCGIRSDTESGVAVFGNSVDNYGIRGYSENSVGVQAEADANYPLVATGNYITAGLFRCFNTTGKDALDVIRLIRIGASPGASMSFETDDGGVNAISNRIKSRFPSTGLSQLAISGVDGAVESELFTLNGTGQLKLNNYTGATFDGAVVKVLGVDASGNVFTTTGASAGTGTTNTISKWSATSGVLTDSSISDNGSGDVTITSSTDSRLFLKVPPGGTVNLLFFQKNNITTFAAGVDAANNYVISSYNPSTGASVGRAIEVTTNTIDVTLTSLAGTGSRMVTADANGKLSTTAIPSASGITGLGTSGNIQTGATQTLATGTSGTAFAIVSSSNTHTFNIPLASTSGVTAGLISNTNYNTFNGKQDALGTTKSVKILSNNVELDNDLITPGNSKVYGTDASGVRGWKADPTNLFQLVVAASDETTPLTTGTSKVTFRMPRGVTLTSVRASLGTAQGAGSIFTVDINENGVSILSTKITIDNNEKTSTTAASLPIISDVNLADDAEMTVDVDQVGDGTARGLKIYLIGTTV